MSDLSQLLFTREHFPVVLDRWTRRDGTQYWDFPRIEIPPYHPSMAGDGINFRSVPDLFSEAVEATIRDLEEIADKREDVRAILGEMPKDESSGRRIYNPRIVKQNNNGITFESVPVVEQVWVGRDGINPYGPHNDNQIILHPGYGAPSFSVPESVVFSPELMREYEMTDAGVINGRRTIESPNLWHRHNLRLFDAIFYRNLVVALDNAVVRQKYQGRTPA